MRFTTWGLIIMGIFCFPLAIIIALNESQFKRDGVVAPGIVTELTNGPYHAVVSVSPRNARPFTFDANTNAGLAVGQHVQVRYLTDRPESTAEALVDGTYLLAWKIAGLGVAFILAALLSPLLVRRFPNVFGYAWAKYFS